MRNSDAKKTKWAAIHAALREDVVRGRLGTAGPLPSESMLMRKWGCARGTVRRAYAELLREGLVMSTPGAGMFVRAQAGSGRIALLLPDSSMAQIFARFVASLSMIAQEAGYVLMLGNAATAKRPSERLHAVKAYVRGFLKQGVDGVIFRPFVGERFQGANREIVAVLSRANVPVVLLDADIAESPSRSRCDLVGIDNVAVGRVVGDYLLSLGRKRIAYLAEGVRLGFNTNWRNRMFGLMGALVARGIAWSSANVLSCPPDDLETMRQIFSVSNHPDAVVCGNDEEAAALMSTLARLHLRIPQDVAVVGCDDIPLA